MASIRKRPRSDGSTTYAVLFTIDGRQTSVPFPDETEAEKFRAVVNSVGGKRAMDAWGIGETKRAAKVAAGPTVAEYLDRHIKALSGVEKKTLTEYRRYLEADIAPALGAIPLGKLIREDVAQWVNAMRDAGAAGGTIQNKSGFLSGALNKAVESGQLAANPCQGIPSLADDCLAKPFVAIAAPSTNFSCGTCPSRAGTSESERTHRRA